MSKIEEKAEKAYPAWRNGIGDEFNSNSAYYGFIEGYHQAEKDNELTWEDIREIYCMTLNLREHLGASVFGEPFYEEVLKRFLNERKEK